MVETFTDRDDFLVYRGVSFLTPSDNKDAALKKQPGSDDASLAAAATGRTPAMQAVEDIKRKRQQEPELPIRKMTEKFARNSDKPADFDVRKRTFNVAQGAFRLDYHYDADRICASYPKHATS